MTERPLLFFPVPQQVDRSKLKVRPGPIRKPDAARQGQRLSPVFKQLQQAFNSRGAEIRQTTVGTEPEQVLVLETIGSVEHFAKAVKKVQGLEWMGELDIDGITPDQDFYNEANAAKTLDGRLYLVMTNQRALQEILSLWSRYQRGEQFGRGFTKFRDVFQCLRSVRRWDVQDRLLESGVIDIWKEDLTVNRDRSISVEIELWFRGNDTTRAERERIITRLVKQAGGQIVGQSVIDGIAYHGMLARLPASAIEAIIKNPDTDLVKCDDIMFFRPVGQMIVGSDLPEGDLEVTRMEEIPLPSGDPVIALFDGAPLTNHHLLSGRLEVDDPDNFQANYAPSERIHGSSMASLIVHGDLNQPQPPLPRPVYVRPIMQPNQTDLQVPHREQVPEDILFVDLIHRSVRRLFDTDAPDGPQAPSIRVINLSIGDPARPFLQSMSPAARLLDWLSHKYDVLFVISAGNHAGAIKLGMARNDYESMTPQDREAVVVRSLFSDTRNRTLLSPAESINGLTVGSLQDDPSQFTGNSIVFNPFMSLLPSPISAFGSGYRKTVKPEIVFPGGKVLYREDFGTSDNEYAMTPTGPSIRNSPPGNKAAVPGRLVGGLADTAYSCGTSNAAALISRAAGIYYDALLQIPSERESAIARAYEVPLLKAMLVHGCGWGEVGTLLGGHLSAPHNDHFPNGMVRRWMGYGIPRTDRLLECTGQRATLLGFGELSAENAHVFRLPPPLSLGSRADWRRLTVTLAWLSPISAGTQKYRTASLWFEVTGASLANNRKEACGGTDGWTAVKRGTVQHEIFEGENAEPLNDESVIEIKVNCRNDAGEIQTPVAYGLIVSLEVAEGVDIAVYDEIRARIKPIVRPTVPI